MTVPTTSNRDLVKKFQSKFVREAQMIADIDHPNIVKVYDIFEQNGTLSGNEDESYDEDDDFASWEEEIIPMVDDDEIPVEYEEAISHAWDLSIKVLSLQKN
ncbi:MAG: hypothetical protein J6W74_03515 [Bacteroidales bacterium]|nr:hypothetical protein [Bacteroidales bacterium]